MQWFPDNNRASHRLVHGMPEGKSVSRSQMECILDQLTWVRFGQFEVERSGVKELVVAKDLLRPRPFTAEERAACMSWRSDRTIEQPWKRWRKAWQASIHLTPTQRATKQSVSAVAYNKQLRSWFLAWVNTAPT